MGLIYADLPFKKESDSWPFNRNYLRLLNHTMRLHGYIVESQYLTKRFFDEKVRPLLPQCAADLHLPLHLFLFSRKQYKSLTRVKNKLPHVASAYLLAIFYLLREVCQRDNEICVLLQQAANQLISYSSVCLPGVVISRELIANMPPAEAALYPDVDPLLNTMDALDDICGQLGWPNHLIM